MPRLRWGAEAPGDRSTARQRLVDAAEACFRRYGLLKTTVEDVARAAEVSRATVYRYFGDRDELILGVLRREADRFLERLAAKIDRTRRFEDALVTGVLFTVETVRSDQNLALLFAPETVGITTSIAGASELLFEMTSEFLRPRLSLARQAGSVRDDIDLDEAAEWTLRTILSLLSVRPPAPRTEADTRRFLSTFLVPALAAPATAKGATRRRRTKRAEAGAGR